MNIQEAFDYLNFWVNKYTGAFFTVSELELLIDRGQMSLYEDLQPKYATSQRIKDALSPFRDVYVIVPQDRNYLNLTELRIYFQISNRIVWYSVPMINDDVWATSSNSQINPVSTTSPLGEQTSKGTFRLSPVHAYNGEVVFLRRPVAPVFGYTIISGRVIVYNPNTSVQLEWSENWINAVLVKALSSIGINLSNQEIQNYSEIKSQSNYQSVNML